MMKEKTSKIDTNMTVEGDVVTDGNLIIEGELLGSFKGGELIVTESGRVRGDIISKRIECFGHIEGSVETSSLFLKKGGSQVGTVITGELEVESGAVIDCVLNSSSGGEGVAKAAKKVEQVQEQVDLTNYLLAFDEESRPCCLEVPWSARLELYDHVQNLLDKDKRLIKIVGEKGSGKSIFASKLLSESLAGIEIIELEEKVGSVTTLLKEVAVKLGLGNGAELTGQGELLGQIRAELFRRNENDQRIVLLIDDAQMMFQATMEGVIRLLSGAIGEEELDAGQCLQIILFGTPEVRSNMVATILEYFEDETNCQLTLDPLTMKDTADYLRLGLQLASEGDEAAMSILPNETIKEIHVRSGGSIAETNSLVRMALQQADSLGESSVSPERIKAISGR